MFPPPYFHLFVPFFLIHRINYINKLQQRKLMRRCSVMMWSRKGIYAPAFTWVAQVTARFEAHRHTGTRSRQTGNHWLPRQGLDSCHHRDPPVPSQTWWTCIFQIPERDQSTSAYLPRSNNYPVPGAGTQQGAAFHFPLQSLFNT